MNVLNLIMKRDYSIGRRDQDIILELNEDGKYLILNVLMTLLYI
jgi:hypothetical protein